MAEKPPAPGKMSSPAGKTPAFKSRLPPVGEVALEDVPLPGDSGGRVWSPFDSLPGDLYKYLAGYGGPVEVARTARLSKRTQQSVQPVVATFCTIPPGKKEIASYLSTASGHVFLHIPDQAEVYFHLLLDKGVVVKMWRNEYNVHAYVDEQDVAEGLTVAGWLEGTVPGLLEVDPGTYRKILEHRKSCKDKLSGKYSALAREYFLAQLQPRITPFATVSWEELFWEEDRARARRDLLEECPRGRDEAGEYYNRLLRLGAAVVQGMAKIWTANKATGLEAGEEVEGDLMQYSLGVQYENVVPEEAEAQVLTLLSYARQIVRNL